MSEKSGKAPKYLSKTDFVFLVFTLYFSIGTILAMVLPYLFMTAVFFRNKHRLRFPQHFSLARWMKY